MAMPFVEHTPENHRRVIDSCHYHLINMRQLSTKEVLISELISRMLPADRLAPDTNTRLIAEIQEANILRVVAASNKITPKRTKLLDISDQERIRLAVTKLRVGFMPIEAQETNRDL